MKVVQLSQKYSIFSERASRKKAKSSPHNNIFSTRIVVIKYIYGPCDFRLSLKCVLKQNKNILRVMFTATDVRSDRQPQPRRSRTESFIAASSGWTTPITATITAPYATGQRLIIREYSNLIR